MSSSNFELNIVTPSGAGGNCPNDGPIRDAAEASTQKFAADNIMLVSRLTYSNEKAKDKKHETPDLWMQGKMKTFLFPPPELHIHDAASPIIFNAIDSTRVPRSHTLGPSFSGAWYTSFAASATVHSTPRHSLGLAHEKWHNMFHCQVLFSSCSPRSRCDSGSQ
jgi:hypothetical protein